MEARSDETAERQRQDLDAPRRKVHLTHASEHQTYTEERDAGTGGECEADEAVCKASGVGWGGDSAQTQLFKQR